MMDKGWSLCVQLVSQKDQVPSPSRLGSQPDLLPPNFPALSATDNRFTRTYLIIKYHYNFYVYRSAP